jgi:hypothetical protein
MAIAYQEQMHGDDLEDVVEEEPDEAASGDWAAEE